MRPLCVLSALHCQLWIQIFDADTDAAAGRRTTAVRLGISNSQLVLMSLLLGETALVHAHFESWPLLSLSAGSTALLAVQILLSRRGGSTSMPISPASIHTTFLVLGLGGVGLMARVWLDAAFI